MVQFFRGSPNPRDAAWGQLATALGQGLGKGITTYQANKTLQDLLNDPSFKDAPISAKKGELQTRMSRYGEVGKEVIQNQMMVEMQAQQEKEQGVLSRALAGEKLSPKDISALSPNTQMGLMRYQQQQETANNKINANILASQSFSKGYRAILDNDIDSLKDVISDPNTPLDVKRQLGSIQNQFAQRADVKGRDVNRRIDSVQNAYRKAISAERNRLGKYGGYRPEEVKAINEKITSLESARDKDMQRLLKNPEEYARLSIWGNPEMSDYLPNERVSPEEQEDEQEEPRQGKIKLASEEHRKEAARRLLRKHKGNKQEAMSEFESLYE